MPVRSHLVLFAALCLAFASVALVAEEVRIELRDGSVLTGELVEVQRGRYRIASSVMGEVAVDERDIVSIRSGGGGGAPVYGQQIADIQRQLVGDSDLRGAVMALQNDAAVQAALNDPDFVRLILSGDLAALQSDPRFLDLMAHPAIQAIIGRLLGP